MKADDDPDTKRDEGLQEALEVVAGAPGHVSAHAGAAPVVAVLERRGRFLTAEPFFARGRRINVEQGRPGGRRRPRAGRADRPARRAREGRSAGSGGPTWRATSSRG